MSFFVFWRTPKGKRARGLILLVHGTDRPGLGFLLRFANNTKTKKEKRRENTNTAHALPVFSAKGARAFRSSVVEKTASSFSATTMMRGEVCAPSHVVTESTRAREQQKETRDDDESRKT